MEKIFAVLNRMEADGVIGRYALDATVFEDILNRHGLNGQWQKFQQLQFQS